MAATRPLDDSANSAHSARPTSFADLGLPRDMVSILTELGITAPFPIQTATLPDALAGRDILGRGRTGSGKTLAFVLPLIARLSAGSRARHPKRPRALILAPTRELATQIAASVQPFMGALSLRSATVFGGVGPNPQISALRAGVDVLIACPGRLEDLISGGHVSLAEVEITVLDEADHMADLGFLPSVRRLLGQTPATGQRMLFSATLDGAVDVIVKQFLTKPVVHSVDSAESPVANMTHHVLHVSHDDRLPILVNLTAAPGRTLVFTRTKHGAKKLTSQLIASGVPAVELHGNLAQNARSRNLLAFSDGTANTLVATDIAARGIHVDDVALVVHADPPLEHKAYLHRSGRTARAGAGGTVITLMTDDQAADVKALTRKAAITATTTRLGPNHPLLAELAPGPRSFVTPPPAPVSTGRSSGKPSTGGRSGRGQSAGGRTSEGRSAGAQPGRGRAHDSSAARRGEAAARRSDGASRSGGASRTGGATRTGGASRTGGSTGGAARAGGPSGGSTRTGGAAAFSAGARPQRHRPSR